MSAISELAGGVLGFGFKQVVDEALAPATTYVGFADAGTLTSANKWSIKRISVAGTTTTIEWANGTNLFTSVWDDRTTLSYS